MSDTLTRLAETIHARRQASADSSYTRQLLDAGPEKCGKKLGEEATEMIIAAIARDDRDLAEEAADVLYHFLVLLESRMLPFARVLEVLEQRMGTSGLAEKAARKS